MHESVSYIRACRLQLIRVMESGGSYVATYMYAKHVAKGKGHVM